MVCGGGGGSFIIGPCVASFKMPLSPFQHDFDKLAVLLRRPVIVIVGNICKKTV